MSFDVLVVPEDPANNGYILKPLVSRMLVACGKANALVTVLSNPRAKGYEHAKGLLRGPLLDRYRHMNLVLFLPDADGKDRGAELSALEEEASRKGVRLLCCAAQEEIEVWPLVGYRDELGKSWKEIRTDVSVKENVFLPFLASHGNAKAPGGGRDLLMAETLRGYRALLRLCPELGELEQRIRNTLES